MKLEIKVDLENDAFFECNGIEAACILTDLSATLIKHRDLDSKSSGILRDSNGNNVGSWKVSE